MSLPVAAAAEAERGLPRLGMPVGLRDTLQELGELKRVRSAGRIGSVAERLFGCAWTRLVADEAPAAVMRCTVAAALAAARLGDIDAAVMAAVGLPVTEAATVRRRAFSEVTTAVDPALAAMLLPGLLPGPVPDDPPPAFVGMLATQPRAGVTCPGRPRLLLEPPENHAEHCLMTAVYGVLLAPAFGADPTTVFLASLAHHLHNAVIPDSGFTGEMLLGPHLGEAFARATDLALAQLGAPLRASVVQARAILPDAATPEGRAFHAADTIDRVLQIAQHLRAAGTTMRVVLDEMELVHEGPVKPFQDRVLAEMGLLA